jgi:hypothetical protein
MIIAPLNEGVKYIIPQNYFQGGSDICLDQVTADHAAVDFAENCMEMLG